MSTFFLHGRWEDLYRWKWVVSDVGVILDTSATHSENFFSAFLGPHLAPKNVKRNYQNGLRMYPELLPHQLRPISTYPNPPICHIGKNQKIKIFCYFYENSY